MTHIFLSEEDEIFIVNNTAYYHPLEMIIKWISLLKGFSEIDSFCAIEVKNPKVIGSDVVFLFSEKVTQEILMPEYLKLFSEEKTAFPHTKFNHVKILDDGLVLVSGADDPLHALYFVFSYYFRKNVPEEERAIIRSLMGEK